MSSMTFNLPTAANKALENSLFIFARDVVGATIAYLREKDIDIRRSDLDAMTLATAIGCGAVSKSVAEKPVRKTGGRKAKAATVTDDADAAFPKYDWFPFCNVVYAGRCKALVARGGLMNQCLAAPAEGCDFCAKCDKKRLGDIRDRVCEGPENTKAFSLTTVKGDKTTKKSPTSLAKYLADLEKRKAGKADAAEFKADALMDKAVEEATRLSRVLRQTISIADWDRLIEKKSRGRKPSSGSSDASASSKTEISVDEIDPNKVLADLNDLSAVQLRKLLKAIAEKEGETDSIKALKKKTDMAKKLKELCENMVLKAGESDESDESDEEEEEEEATEEEKATEETDARAEEATEETDARAKEPTEEEEELEVEEEDEEDDEEEEEDTEEAKLAARRLANAQEYDITAIKNKSYAGTEVAVKGNEVFSYDTETETVGNIIGAVRNGKIGLFKKTATRSETAKA